MRAVGLELAGALARCAHRYTLLARQPEHYTNRAREAGLLRGAEHPLLAAAERVDTNALDALVAASHALHAQRPFDGVITTCDYSLEAAASVADALGLPGPRPAEVRGARHEHWMREACPPRAAAGSGLLLRGECGQSAARGRGDGVRRRALRAGAQSGARGARGGGARAQLRALGGFRWAASVASAAFALWGLALARALPGTERAMPVGLAVRGAAFLPLAALAALGAPRAGTRSRAPQPRCCSRSA